MSTHIHTPEDPRVFVFGSNLLGIHGAGAARYARKLGAELGVGEGLTGRAYALPTCYRPGEPVTYAELMVYVENFLDFARKNPQIEFFVSAVGCGIAGFDESEVAPLFMNAPENCSLPPNWKFACQRMVPGNIDGKCGKPPTHIYRYEYIPTMMATSVVKGATQLCQEHHDDSQDLRSEASPTWVKL